LVHFRNRDCSCLFQFAFAGNQGITQEIEKGKEWGADFIGKERKVQE